MYIVFIYLYSITSNLVVYFSLAEDNEMSQISLKADIVCQPLHLDKCSQRESY